MPVFRSPGLADEDASDAVLVAWNKLIVEEVQGRPASPALALDPATITDGVTVSAQSSGDRARD